MSRRCDCMPVMHLQVRTYNPQGPEASCADVSVSSIFGATCPATTASVPAQTSMGKNFRKKTVTTEEDLKEDDGTVMLVVLGWRRAPHTAQRGAGKGERGAAAAQEASRYRVCICALMSQAYRWLRAVALALGTKLSAMEEEQVRVSRTHAVT